MKKKIQNLPKRINYNTQKNLHLQQYSIQLKV